MITPERRAAIQQRVKKATDGPWAWESVAEKSNEFVVGLAWREDETPILGAIEPPDPDAMQDTIIRRSGIGENETGHANFADAEFIAHARSDIPDLLAEVDRLRGIIEALTADMDRAGGDGHGMPECPWCHADWTVDGDPGHDGDCELLKARAALAPDAEG